MNKRFVEITFKETGNVRRFPTITKMFKELGDNVIGITRNSLWNGLGKNDGVYENNKVKVEYKETWIQNW